MEKDSQIKDAKDAIKYFFKGKLHKRNFFALYREDKTEEETN